MATPYDGYLTVTDLKQYTHCARVTYFEHCLPHIRPRTYKMDAGRDAHAEEAKRAARRTLRQYGLPEGERHFDVALICADLRLSGEIDEVVITPEDEHIPVDYKLAKKVGKHHRLQLAAYALMLESVTGTNVGRGFVYLIPQRETVEVIFTPKLKAMVARTMADIHTMILHERMPDRAPHANYCVSCEFRRFCNDVAR